MNTHKLKGLKSADALDNLNRDADDVLHRMMDESSSAIIKNLHGHSGPVSKESFLFSYITYVLEPVCCKKRKKKSQPRNWFGE